MIRTMRHLAPVNPTGSISGRAKQRHHRVLCKQDLIEIAEALERAGTEGQVHLIIRENHIQGIHVLSSGTNKNPVDNAPPSQRDELGES